MAMLYGRSLLAAETPTPRGGGSSQAARFGTGSGVDTTLGMNPRKVLGALGTRAAGVMQSAAPSTVSQCWLSGRG